MHLISIWQASLQGLTRLDARDLVWQVLVMCTGRHSYYKPGVLLLAVMLLRSSGMDEVPIIEA